MQRVEIKIMVQDQWRQLKIKFLLDYNMKIVVFWVVLGVG